jgi:hypothetical protein
LLRRQVGRAMAPAGAATMDIKIVIALLIVGTLLLLVNYFPSPK